MNKNIRSFLIILAAAMAASILGAVFAVILAYLSPELIRDLFGQKNHPVRFAASVGMIWGLFIGAGTMAFCYGISAISNWFSPRGKEGDAK